MTTKPRLTLWYFPFPGRGEAIRDAFRIGGIEFDDVRLAFDQFQAKRDAGELPFGSLPVLHVECASGARFHVSQSNAILRYAGKLARLYPTDDHERALRIDEIVAVGEDVLALFVPSIAEKDDTRRMEMRRHLADETLPRAFRRLEGRLDQAGDDGWFVGSDMSIADLKMIHIVDKLLNGSLDGIPPTLIDPYPRLCAWRAKVHDIRAARLAHE